LPNSTADSQKPTDDVDNLPGTGIRLDPDRITQIEICCLDATRAEVRILSTSDAPPRLFSFPDKAAAIDFYRKVWLLRSGETLDDRQIENLIDSSNS